MAAIQVLGTGCAKCTQLVKNAQKAVDELGRGDTVEKIIDIMRVPRHSCQGNSNHELKVAGTIHSGTTPQFVTYRKRPRWMVTS